METDGKLTATQAKEVLAELVAPGRRPGRPSPRRSGFEAMDAGDLEAVVDEAIAANPGAWEKFLAGDDKATGAFIGDVMKARPSGKADGKAVTALLQQKRAAASGG